MRNEGYDILIMARTDANHTHGLVKQYQDHKNFMNLEQISCLLKLQKIKKK